MTIEVKRVDERIEHYKDGVLHREGDLPAIEWSNGDKEWSQNGLLHREGGPAIEYADGSKSWYQNGLRHRETGPAIELADGSKEWWVNGVQLTKEEFNKKYDFDAYAYAMGLL